MILGMTTHFPLTTKSPSEVAANSSPASPSNRSKTPFSDVSFNSKGDTASVNFSFCLSLSPSV